MRRVPFVLVATAAAMVTTGAAAAPPDAHVHPLVAQPRWLASYCRREAERLGPRILCPTRVPTDFTPSANTRSLSGERDAYVIDAGGFDRLGAQTSHWVVGAFDGWGKRGLRDWTTVSGLRPVGAARVRGQRGRWFVHGSGIFAGHLMLVWDERGWVYVISDHIDYPFNAYPSIGVGSRALRREMIRIAAAMRPYRCP